MKLNKIWIYGLVFIGAAVTARDSGENGIPAKSTASQPTALPAVSENDIRSRSGAFKPSSLRTVEDIFRKTATILKSIGVNTGQLQRELEDIESSLADKKIGPAEQAAIKKKLLTTIARIHGILDKASDELIQNRRPLEFEGLENLKRDIAASKAEQEYTKTQLEKYESRDAEIDRIIENIDDEYGAFEADINEHRDALKKYETSLNRWLPLIFNGLTIEGLQMLINDLDGLNSELKKLMNKGGIVL